MKARVRCETCGKMQTVDRYCKNIDGSCKNIEGTGNDWDFIPWCNIPCSREGGRLLSKKEVKAKEEAMQNEEIRLDRLREQFKNGCPHPKEEQYMYDHAYSYGDIYYYQCKVCGFAYKKYGDDSRGTSHDYDLGA